MLNRTLINKAQLIGLINEYDHGKGFGRKFFGSSNGIKKLKNFIDLELANKNGEYQLNDIEIKALITLIKNRFQRVIRTDRNYRYLPNRLTNQIYIKLANFVSAYDPKILLFVQAYKNDYTFKYSYLCESQDDIFVTTDGYAFTTSDIKEHIKSTESLSYPEYPGSSKYTKPLSENDISKLKSIQSIRTEIEIVEKMFSSYQNTETFVGESLFSFPKNRLFIAEDKYCFLIDELLKILNEQNKFYNPYTKMLLSEKDIERLLELPEIINAKNILKLKQNSCASKISNQTILELKKMAESLLNKKEIHNDFFDPIPRAQNAYDEFNEYYQALDVSEREALNGYWIDGWSTVESLTYYVSGMAPTKFKDLYESMDISCVHSVGGSTVKMVIELAPDTKFNVSGFLAKAVVNSINNSTDLNSSAYVTGNQSVLTRKYSV